MIRLILEQDGEEYGSESYPRIITSFEHDSDVPWNDLLKSFLRGLNTLDYVIDVEEMMDVLQMYTEERIKMLMNRNEESDFE